MHVICESFQIDGLRSVGPIIHLNMRRFAVFLHLLLAGCISRVTATEVDTRDGVYTLASVDLDSLPTRPDYLYSSRWVVSGSLTLQSDGYFVLTERDSVWNGHTFAREDHLEGGRWMSDGSLLTLSDTAGAVLDPYGSAAATYTGSIAPSGVLLTIPADDGTETHVYQYRR